MKYFEIEEFKCRCGCGQADMSEPFLDRLDKARELAGVPFAITSGYRCRTHDEAVGGKGNHTTGLAADIAADSGDMRFRIVQSLIEAGFRRVGIGKDFIHVDDVPGKPAPTIWLY